MLRAKRVIHIRLFLSVLAYTAFVTQALAGITIDLPVFATVDPLVDPINSVLGSGELADMRENMAIDTVTTQSNVTFDANGVQTSPDLPMQGELAPMLQNILMPSIKSQMMTSLADPDNPDGAVFLFAPSFVKDIYFPPPAP